MKGFCWPARIVHASFILGPALCLVIAHTPVEAGISVSRVAMVDPEIGVTPNAAVLRIKDAAPAADDTGRNVRDRDNRTLTPTDQSNDPEDVNLTRAIRKALVEDDALSTTAKNIKIITVQGKVTLRGPVSTVQEKAAIVQKAQQFTKKPIANQLEVASR